MITVPASDFVPFLSRVRANDLKPDGRHIRADAFATVVLRAPVAAARIASFTVNFQTSENGPTLRSVEFRNGQGDRELVLGRKTGFARSDFTSNFQDDPVNIPPGTSVRLEVSFPGGIDTVIDPGEFILTNVLIDDG